MQRDDDVVAPGSAIGKPPDRYPYYNSHLLQGNDAAAAASRYSYYSAPFPKPHGERERLESRRCLQQVQDMVNRHALCLKHIRECAAEVESLRIDNLALRSFNGELNRHLYRRRLSPLLLEQQTAADCEDHDHEAEEEQDLDEERPMGATDSSPEVQLEGSNDLELGARVSLPKSISVRTKAYLSNNRGAPRLPSPSQTTPLAGAQKLYVHGGGKEGDEPPMELEVYNQGMFKTELCNKWQETGHCPYGENCRFAHGLDDLRPVIRHPRYKTEVCRMVLTGDPCPYGHRCHFRHALTEQERFVGRGKLPKCSTPARPWTPMLDR